MRIRKSSPRLMHLVPTQEHILHTTSVQMTKILPVFTPLCPRSGVGRYPPRSRSEKFFEHSSAWRSGEIFSKIFHVCYESKILMTNWGFTRGDLWRYVRWNLSFPGIIVNCRDETDVISIWKSNAYRKKPDKALMYFDDSHMFHLHLSRTWANTSPDEDDRW